MAPAIQMQFAPLAYQEWAPTRRSVTPDGEQGIYRLKCLTVMSENRVKFPVYLLNNHLNNRNPFGALPLLLLRARAAAAGSG